jgi:hypothetical protein
MNLFVNVRAAFAGGAGEQVLAATAADAEEPVPPADLRCLNEDCDLYQLRLEADEVAPTPGAQPDRCASCGQPLRPYSEAPE